jgi:hypothetical protein
MTLRQAAKKAKNELQNEAVTTIKKQTFLHITFALLIE